jgi:flavin-dependent thymidylate synthase
VNEVELLGHYGSDEVIAQSAWTSTSREMTEGKCERIGKLLHMLASQGHHTPFEKTGLHFLVTTDIATHIQLLKHRIGVSINAESARYKELKEDKYFLPEDWKGIKVSDETHSIFADDWMSALKEYTKLGNDLYHRCIEDLEPILGRKRAKESARFFKTYNSQITADIMFNWRSFYHFLNLRNKEDAQLEIRELAEKMLNLVKNLQDKPFKHTIEAFKV